MVKHGLDLESFLYDDYFTHHYIYVYIKIYRIYLLYVAVLLNAETRRFSPRVFYVLVKNPSFIKMWMKVW